MKIFFVYLQSPEQVRSFNMLKESIMAQRDVSLFFVTRFKLQGQSEYSQMQYSKSLKTLAGFNTFMIAESISSKLHPLLLKSALTRKKISFVIGNFSEYYGRTIYEKKINSEIIVVDDGADVVISASKAVSIENKHSNLTFFSKYRDFIEPKSRNSKYDYPANSVVVHQMVSLDILGILGGPYVELEGLDLKNYENLILQIMKKLGCKEVYYFMHRRENKKFFNSQIHEFIDEKYSSVELLDSFQVIPGNYWTFTSSALLDIFLKYGNDSDLNFYFTKPIFSRSVPKFFLDRKIDLDQNLLDVFRSCNFYEISSDIEN